MKRTLALVALVGALGWPATSPAAPKLRTYVVKPGDSCWSIALRFFGRGQKYSVVHRYNQLGALPHILEPGQKLRLPIAGDAPDALVEWLYRDVKAKSPRAADWRRAEEKMALWRLYKVATGGGSSAGIVFEDNAKLRLRERALLVIYGGVATAANKIPRSGIVLESGVVKGGLDKLDRAASLKVKTPSAVYALRSRSAQLEVDSADQTSIVSVYDGKARVSAQRTTVTVPTDFGTFVNKGKPPERPRPLPPAPTWSAPGHAVIASLAGRRVTLDARWNAVKEAARYRLELAADATFRYPIADAVIGAGVTRFSARNLAVGRYHARVAAIDKDRLEGRPSRVLHVHVVAVKASRVLAPGADGVLEAVGMFALDTPATPAGLQVAVNDGDFSPERRIRLVGAGLRNLRFRVGNDGQIAETQVRVLAAGAKFSHREIVVSGAKRLEVTVSVRDERNRPAVLPGVRVGFDGPVMVPGPEVSKPAPASATVSLVPAPEARTITFFATWPGGDLGRYTVKLPAPPPPPPVVPVFAWPEDPVGAEWSRGGPAMPSRGARPATHLGLSTYLAGASASAGDDPLLLRVALRGGLSVLDDRLGLDVDVPWIHRDLGNDRPGFAELGDLRLGLRGVLIATPTLTLSPAARVAFPTGQLAGVAHNTLVEPGALLDWTPLSWLTVTTNQLLVIEAGDETRAYYAGVFGAAAQLVAGLRAAIELDALIELTDGSATASPPRAVALAAAVRWHHGRLRIGLAAGAGLNGDGQAVFGTFTTGLTVDLGFFGL